MISLLNKFDDNYIIEEKDVLQIVDYYLKNNSLDNYLKDVIFVKDSHYIAGYSVSDNVMKLNNEKMWQSCHRKTDKIDKMFDIGNYKSYFLNFYYISIIFHELTHAVQKNKYDSFINTNNLFSYLYELCSMIEYSGMMTFNNDYNLLPMEIEANNVGLLKSYQLMTYTKLPSRETQLMYSQYLSSLLSNYKKINDKEVSAPINKLHKKINEIDMEMINSLIEQERLSKVQRLNYGLDISSKVYDSIDKEKQKILLKNR